MRSANGVVGTGAQLIMAWVLGVILFVVPFLEAL